MKLLKLQEVRNDEPTYVRPSAIISVHNPGDDAYTELVLDGGQRLVVKDSPDRILKAMGHEDREIL